MLSIDSDANLPELFNLIVSCVLSNNVVYLAIKNGLTNSTPIKQFADMFSQDDSYFKNMIVIDTSNTYLDQSLKPLIKHNRKHIGTYIRYSEQRQNVNFHSLEHKLFTSKTTFKPRDVLDNTN